MRKLGMFMSITANGYYADADGGMSFAHAPADPEFQKYVEGNASSGGLLLFGGPGVGPASRIGRDGEIRTHDP